MIGGKPTSIYVVQAQNGFIKIGVSTNPKSRAYAIHVHSPIPCRLIATWPGGIRDEMALHARFEPLRGHAEWFACVGTMADFVQEVFGRGLDAVEDWGSRVPSRHAERVARSHQIKAEKMKSAWQKPGAREEWSRCIRLGQQLARERASLARPQPEAAAGRAA